jgi:Gpi18-like mannosyltransferase
LVSEKAYNPIYPHLTENGGQRINLSVNKRELTVLAGLLFASFVIRLLLFSQQGYPVDTNDFRIWSQTASSGGIRSFYANSTFIDYPPFNIYIFWLIGTFAKAFSILNIDNWVKLAPNLFDLATATVIFLYLKKQTSFKMTILGTALYAFNPATIYNAAVWGQFDAIYTFLLILSLVLALKGKPAYSILSAVAFALGVLTKPQAIALAPLIALLIYERGGLNKRKAQDLFANAWPKLKILLVSIIAFTITVFIVILPFQWTNNNPISFLSKIYFGAYGGYAYTSINAFNLWGLFGMWQSDANFFALGWAMFGALAVFVLYFVHKRLHSNEALALFGAFMLFFAFFMLPTRIHERYLFPAISVLALMFPLLKKTRPLYIGLTVTLLVNQAYVLYGLKANYPNAGPNLTGDPVALAVGFANLIMFLFALVLMVDELRTRRDPNSNLPKQNMPREGSKNKG